MLFQKTLTKATVELVDGQSIEDGFQLLVGLAEIHVPRMWVEKKTGDLDHQVSRVVRKPAFCKCENKEADQLPGNREADQCLCFRYTDRTLSLLPKYEISSL